MEIEEAVLSQAFESIMTPIMALVDGQVEKLCEKRLGENLKGILLVGGLSKSKYLHNRMRQEFPGNDNLKVWQVDNS